MGDFLDLMGVPRGARDPHLGGAPDRLQGLMRGYLGNHGRMSGDVRGGSGGRNGRFFGIHIFF